MQSRPFGKISFFSRSEIEKLFKEAKIRTRYSGIKVLTAPVHKPPARILIVTPRASGTAPERNLFKRRVRALFREHQMDHCPTNIIVIVDKRGINLPFSKLRHLLLNPVQEQPPCLVP